MAIVLPIDVAQAPSDGGFGPPPGSGTNCFNYIGYNNKLAEGVVDNATMGEPLDATDWKSFTAWKFGPGDHSFEVGFSDAASMDYFAIAFYKMGGAASVKLQYWNGSDFITVATIDEATELGRPIMKRFDQESSDLWRVLVEGSAADSYIAVMSAGQWIGIPQQDHGWTPPRLARKTKILSNDSESGVFLGKSILRQALEFEITATFLQIDWAYSTWLAFIKHAEQLPFFFQWEVTFGGSPVVGDTVYCWVEEEIEPPEFAGGYHIDAVVPVKGVAE